MTCICAVVHENGSITFGADSAGSSEYAIMSSESKKIFVRDDLLFGVAGSWRKMQLLHYGLLIPERKNNANDEEYIVISLVNAIKSCFETCNVEQDNSSILIGYRGRIYRMNQDYGLVIPTEYDAIGVGDDVAKGVLYATKGFHPQERIRLALSAAQEHIAFVRPPFIYETIMGDAFGNITVKMNEPTLAQWLRATSSFNFPRIEFGFSEGQASQLEGDDEDGTRSTAS